MEGTWDWAGAGIENTDISVFASVFENVFLSRNAVILSFTAHHSMLFPTEPHWVTLHLLCNAVLFSIDFLVVDTGFEGWGVVSISTNMNIFYHQNSPRSLVIFSWKLSSGCIFTFLFLVSSGAATHSVGFLCAAAVLIGLEKMKLLLSSQEDKGTMVMLYTIHPHVFVVYRSFRSSCLCLLLIPDSGIQDQDLLQKIGNTPPSFLFQWLRSSSAPANASLI